MDFSYSTEQQLLKDSASRFALKGYGFERYRATLGLSGHLDPAIWAQMAEFGWLALPVPEVAGGLAGSGVDLALVAEALGAGMVLEPFVSGAVLPARLVGLAGDVAAQSRLLEPLAAGALQLAVAWSEPGDRQNPAVCATQASRHGEGYVLSGRKQCVLNAPNAHRLIVSARTAGKAGETAGISQFELDLRAPGVLLKSYTILGGGSAADIVLDGVEIPASAMLGSAGGGFEPLSAALDLATTASCAQALGAMGALFERTANYLKIRKQFGVPIGSFQVLQHRLVDMFVEIEQSRSMVLMAGVRVDSADAFERRRAVSAAKAYLGKASKFVAQQAVQLHGGVGVTEELDVGHLFRQLTCFAMLYGDREYHLDRIARNSRLGA
ncbi:MAG: acyl-CoA dehydrogenase family protein [Paraburkholderia fungorum]|nr:acyl-CoA dehydrogenase family protein [Paraburkholderia fungorum]